MKEFYPISEKDTEALESVCKKLPENANILEIGCGNSTSVLMKYGTLTSVDIDQERLDFYKPNKAICISSLDFIPTEMYDLIFIDGEHIYNFIYNDLEKLYPQVKSGGFLTGHDYEGLPFDEAFIHTDCVGEKHHGVVKAVSEKLKEVTTYPNSCVWSIQKL